VATSREMILIPRYSVFCAYIDLPTVENLGLNLGAFVVIASCDSLRRTRCHSPRKLWFYQPILYVGVVLVVSECCICCFSILIEVVFVSSISCVVADNFFAVYHDGYHQIHQGIILRVFGLQSLALAMVFLAEDLLV
jgi:hypothetical protein